MDLQRLEKRQCSLRPNDISKKMKNKKAIAYLLLLILGFSVGYFLKPSVITAPVVFENSTTEIKEVITSELNPKELEAYYRIYKNPYVILLRKTLDAYLANDSSKACIFQGAVEETRMTGIISGLDAFSKDYYKSKFVVATIDDNAENGKDIQIIFQDKPDRIFYAWIGKNPYQEDCLLGFNSKEDFEREETREKMKQLIEPYRQFLFDKEHAI